MKCSKCNGKRIKTIGSIIKDSVIAGKVSIPDITYLKCSNQKCGMIVYPPGESQKIFDFIKAKERGLITKQPIGDFIDSKEACKILQITKQAFSKNKRIKRGFIISQIIGEKRFYLIQSVMKFKKSFNKDGRLSLKIILPEVVPEIAFYNIFINSNQNTTIENKPKTVVAQTCQIWSKT